MATIKEIIEKMEIAELLHLKNKINEKLYGGSLVNFISSLSELKEREYTHNLSIRNEELEIVNSCPEILSLQKLGFDYVIYSHSSCGFIDYKKTKKSPFFGFKFSNGKIYTDGYILPDELIMKKVQDILKVDIADVAS